MNFYKNLKKGAVVAAHFGTTHEDTKEKTIDVINKKLKIEFQKLDFFEVYTSRIINRILSKKGINNLNTSQMLEKLYKEGYQHVIVQPTYIINGTEMEALKREVEMFNDKFEDIRLGTPLLSNVDDYFNLIDIVEKDIPELEEDKAIVLIGHGTNHPAFSVYPTLAYIARDLNKPIYVGTIDGYPTVDNVIKELKRDKKTKLVLMPLLFVAGDHAKNDIAEDWKNTLEENGFKVELNLKGLGEIEAIQEIYVEKAKILENTQPEDILLKKAEYAKGKKACH
ncbi:sirohydrochlorin cobaltochelatase [Candidatus Cetobacterium colombiensis]|uniref:Sirohydrochlorin cobaltochelatase n=1 Tax=Candidatus Cetobacterium colombiensis TaxID=3073100 RepID=A0ABU4WC30_9FUSO|nr:sirohydrochlorin cobaltochelatase [Candidatus Cetobacterium colombiensis]MDX8336769.1 sirohydrochlorin cobaltochelatase [Candidatus Cetobacterium colombiensis]